MIHSSFKSLGLEGENAADRVIEGLLLAAGGGGTVLFPALSFDYVTAANPVFDVKKTKSCAGFLSEHFRINYAFRRSLNPTHSVSGTGKDAGYFLDGHIIDDSPFGKNSPYSKLKDRKGKIIMLGCGLRPNTSMHALEQAGRPCKREGKTL